MKATRRQFDSSTAVRSLRFAVRPGVVARQTSSLMLPFAALLLPLWAFALVQGEWPMAFYYGGAMFATGGVALLLRRLPRNGQLQINEAMVVSALAFCIASLVMAIPMMGHGLPFREALFESVSAITSTGLSLQSDMASHSALFLLGRAWLQWIGGLGIVILAIALMHETDGAARRLGYDPRAIEDRMGGVRSHARRLLVIYLVLTLLGIALLLALGNHPLDAVVYALTAVATGGFGNYDSSLLGLNGWSSYLAVIALCIAGAVAFTYYYVGLYGARWLLLDRRPRILLVICAFSVVLLYLPLGLQQGFHWETFGHAAIMAISAQTTAGFSSLDTASLPAAAKLMMCGYMFVGGELGSTAGGIKIVRLIILIELFRLVIARAAVTPRAHLVARVYGQRVTPREIEGTIALIFGYAGTVLLIWLIFLCYDLAPLDALFDVVSATATAGLSTGIVSAELPALLIYLLCFAMLLGRLEIIALVVLILPTTWMGRHR